MNRWPGWSDSDPPAHPSQPACAGGSLSLHPGHTCQGLIFLWLLDTASDFDIVPAPPGDPPAGYPAGMRAGVIYTGALASQRRTTYTPNQEARKTPWRTTHRPGQFLSGPTA